MYEKVLVINVYQPGATGEKHIVTCENMKVLIEWLSLLSKQTNGAGLKLNIREEYMLCEPKKGSKAGKQ